MGDAASLLYVGFWDYGRISFCKLDFRRSGVVIKLRLDSTIDE